MDRPPVRGMLPSSSIVFWGERPRFRSLPQLQLTYCIIVHFLYRDCKLIRLAEVWWCVTARLDFGWCVSFIFLWQYHVCC